MLEAFIFVGLTIYTIFYMLKFRDHPEEDLTSGICFIVLLWLYLMSVSPALVQGYRFLMRLQFVQNMPIIFIFIFEIFAVIVFILSPVLALFYIREEWYSKRGDY